MLRVADWRHSRVGVELLRLASAAAVCAFGAHAMLLEVIGEIHHASQRTYGARRIHAELVHGRGVAVARCTVELVMRRNGLAGLPGRHADFETHQGDHASVEPDRSQPSTGSHTLAEPTEAAGSSRANPANDLPDATTSQPHRPVPTYKSAVQLGEPAARCVVGAYLCESGSGSSNGS